MIHIDKVKISEELLLDISYIEAFNAKFPYISKDSTALNLLKAQARIAGTAASTRIEGSNLKDYEVERVLGGISSATHKEKDINEARGYAAALDYINENYEIMDINERNLKKIHALITASSNSEYRKSGNPHQNIQYDEPDMINASAIEIPTLTIELLNETNMLLKSKSHHPLIVVALFLVHFLTINPFEDGNGRLSRLTSSMLLQKAGYSFISCYAFESIIEETRKTYLYALKRAQQTFKSEPDYSPWLNYFMKTLIKTCTRLEPKLSKQSEKEKSSELSPIEADIIELINEHGKIYTAQILESLNWYKAPTIKKALANLVRMSEIEQMGKGRGTYYKIPKA